MLRGLLLEHVGDLLDGHALRLRQERQTKTSARTHSAAKQTSTQPSPIAALPGREHLDERVVGQPVDGRTDRRRLAADRGREVLALDQPAGAADADRERGDEQVEADHREDDPRRAGHRADADAPR